MLVEIDTDRRDHSRPTRVHMGIVPVKEFPHEDVYFHKPKNVTLRERRSIPSGTSISDLNRKREIHAASHDRLFNERNRIRVAKNELARLKRVKNPQPYQLQRMQEAQQIVDNEADLVQAAIDYINETNEALPLADRQHHSNL